MLLLLFKRALVSVLIYNISIGFYRIAILFASMFNQKAKLWINGRKGVFKKLKTSIPGDLPLIWMHCASLGEFEQGRPVLEKLKPVYPNHKILLTFFSPSGYEVRKNYAGADWVFYLPLDTKKNASQFIDIVNPQLAIFVKYEYWYNYLTQLNEKKIPTVLISAIFREKDIFFKWYGWLYRIMLGYFTHIFVQTAESFSNIKEIVSSHKITLAGDTRFDRVIEIANNFTPIAPIEQFIKNKKIIVAGSTWPEDETNLKRLLEKCNIKLSLIIAPHEIKSDHIEFLITLFPQAVLYSNLIKNKVDPQSILTSNVLIIDNIGMLSSLYNYGAVTYIGGGFNKSGIHNTLEAAVYSKPVIFGANYQKFSEAIILIKIKGGFSYVNYNQLVEIINNLFTNSKYLEHCSKNAGSYVRENTGATDTILNWIRQISF